MTVKLYDLARVTTATVGTGTITLGSSVAPFLSFAAAGVQNGDTVRYAIYDPAGGGSEIGTGIYSSSTLTRNPTSSTNGNAPIVLSGSAQVLIAASAEDFENLNAQSIVLSGIPSLSETFSASVLAGFSDTMTAASATVPELAAFISITSSIGAANGLSAYKMALGTTTTVNSGSAYGWGINPVVNIGAGGTQRGGVVIEADLNNSWGNYSGSPATPYAVNFYATGTNAGGYSTAAFAAEFAGNNNPMWQAGLHAGPADYQVFNTAFLWDETNSPIVLKATGSHTTGIDFTGATFSGFDFSGTKVNASDFYLNGILFAQQVSSTYTVIFDPSGGSDTLQLGNATDPTNYYQNTSHIFRNRAQTTTWVTITSAGLAIDLGVLAAPLTTQADNATGTVGMISWDASYIYVCTATNTWKRAALSSF